MPFGDYTVPPGAWLQEWIEDQGTTRDQAAEDLGWSRKKLDEVVDGTAPVKGDMPAELAELTGIPADAWQRYEAQYRADLNRIFGHRANPPLG